MSRHTMTKRELLAAAHADVREALGYLKGGFVVCSQCGHEETTLDFDAVLPLKDAARRLAILRGVNKVSAGKGKGK